MKKLLIYGILLALALLYPLRGADVGKLCPVEVVQVSREGNVLVIATDTDDRGEGVTIGAALRNLKETTPGTIYLDTADYLVVTEEAADTLAELQGLLKSSVRVCIGPTGLDLKEAAEYLASHCPQYTLKEAEKADRLEKLTIDEKRLILR